MGCSGHHCIIPSLCAACLTSLRVRMRWLSHTTTDLRSHCCFHPRSVHRSLLLAASCTPSSPLPPLHHSLPAALCIPPRAGAQKTFPHFSHTSHPPAPSPSAPAQILKGLKYFYLLLLMVYVAFDVTMLNLCRSPPSVGEGRVGAGGMGS